ncbi:Uncharacterized protein APZ42_032028 [Daphnia magna]|uniref:Integrase catalytic domain-containing protein n=1 Tax=Daphnia magna TaxID=35525 RepID=A0A164MCB7_9CRUS|nr:Uncharacterized protein APZ42_032028 [Daphnia magna]
MYSITLRKLPGSKKEFAHVKSVVDNRRPGSSKAPSVPAMQNKPDDNKPSSGRAVSEKEIARPLTVQIRPPWNSSTKIERTPDLYIKPLPGTRIGHVQFKARSVPEKNVQPFRPVLPSKTRQPTRKPKADDESVAGQKNQENKLVEDVNIRNPVEMTPVSPQQAPHEINEIPEKAADVSAGSADPGLMSRMWHSMVDPILNSKKPDDEGAGDDEEVAVKQPESEAPPVTEEPGVPAMTGAESPASEERVFPSVAENKKDGSPEMAIEANVIDSLSEEFDTRSLPATSFLGLDLHLRNHKIIINQPEFIKKVLSKLNMGSCKPTTIPMDPGTRQMSSMSPTSKEEIFYMAKVPYREANGAFLLIDHQMPDKNGIFQSEVKISPPPVKPTFPARVVKRLASPCVVMCRQSNIYLSRSQSPFCFSCFQSSYFIRYYQSSYFLREADSHTQGSETDKLTRLVKFIKSIEGNSQGDAVQRAWEKLTTIDCRACSNFYGVKPGQNHKHPLNGSIITVAVFAGVWANVKFSSCTDATMEHETFRSFVGLQRRNDDMIWAADAVALKRTTDTYEYEDIKKLFQENYHGSEDINFYQNQFFKIQQKSKAILQAIEKQSEHINSIASFLKLTTTEPARQETSTSPDLSGKIDRLTDVITNLGSIMQTSIRQTNEIRNFSEELSEEQVNCSESDVELYNVHNKKFFTLGLVSLPVVYGAIVLDQEFIVMNGISESCILGLDAAEKHEFIFDCRSKTILLARDKPEGNREVKQNGLLPTSQEPVVNLVMTLLRRVSIAPRSSQVLEATLKGQGDKLGTCSLFLFSNGMDLPEGIYIGNFINAKNENRKYQMVIENNSNKAHTQPMSFGLCNAPATFQRLMNHILGDVAGRKALVYLDDVMIFSDSFKSHLKDIREVFFLIKGAGLKLKFNKYQFMKQSVNYLGHVISTDGIGADSAKVDKIANYKVSTLAEEVRSFLGLAGHQLKPAEQKYATVEKEALAVVLSIKHFRHYLLDKPFTAETQPDILASQAADPLCQSIKKYLDDGVLSEENEKNMPIWAKEISLYQVTNGILYRIETPTLQSKYQLYSQAFLFPHELAKFPFQVIGIDFLGPIQSVSPNGNNCFCVITDYFTKYGIAVPLPDQTARTTAECVYKQVVLKHGPQLAIVSDRGPNFTSGLFKYFCKQINIEQRFTTAYNPESNGDTERFNRILTNMLRKELVDGQHHNWEDVLGEICFAYRASVHSSTNESPYYMMHGRDCNLPKNKILGAVPKPILSSGGYVDKLLESLRYSFHRAQEENEKTRGRQREQYNKKAKVFDYKPGDRVLLDVRVVQKGDKRKLTLKFRGPYLVVKVYPNRTGDIAENSYNCQLVH